MTLEQRYSEAHEWQGSDYDGTITFPNADNTFGSHAPEPIDLARIYTAVDGSTTAYDRSGAQVEMSDAEVNELNSSPQASLSPVEGPVLSRAANSDVGALAGRPPRDKREPVDRVLVTPAGSLRALARLRAANTETPGPGGALVFTRREGSVEIRETWNPALGAVTEILTTGADGGTTRTLHRYVREGSVLALAEEQTAVHDGQGKLLGRFALQYRNHTLR